VDKATLAGIVLGLLTILGAIMASGSAADFMYWPALLVVLGGTTAGTLIKFPLRHVLNSFRIAAKTFYEPREDPRDLIERTKELSKRARQRGLLALEDEPVPNAFYHKALQLSVDGLEPERIQQILREDLNLSLQRHETGQRIFRSIGEQAPAFGMIGTLVGLVQMLGNLENPETVGPGMAVALLTTLYGAVFAHLVALPIADNLEMRAEAEHTTKTLVVEAVECIHQGCNSRVIEEMLLPFLPHAKRSASVESTASGEPR
jgi:chemotaxis protein MotA